MSFKVQPRGVSRDATDRVNLFQPHPKLAELKIMEVIPNLSELDNHVRTNKWYALGLQLGIEDNELEAIEKHRSGDIDECRRAMFRKWLHTTSNACRKELLNALRTKAVDEIAIAKEYEKLFIKTPHPGMRTT